MKTTQTQNPPAASAHTPGPLALRSPRYIEANGKIIADCLTIGGQFYASDNLSQAEAEGNAERIIEAVNSAPDLLRQRDELRSALEECLDWSLAPGAIADPTVIQRIASAALARTKCEFQRHLDALPFPAAPAPDLKPRLGTRGRRQATLYGTWLHEHNYAEFLRLYTIWRDAPNT